MMMLVVTAAFLALVCAGIHTAHRNEAEHIGMNSYMDNEFRVVAYTR